MIRYQQIHHISLNVRDLEECKRFYKEILGLEELERPPFSFPGAWFAIGDFGQQLHLIQHDGETLRGGGLNSRDGHFALEVASYDETVRWLTERKVSFDARPTTTAGFPQIYVMDPDRNIIELNVQATCSEKSQG